MYRATCNIYLSLPVQNIQILDKFRPSLPGTSTTPTRNQAAAIKSVIEVVRRKESYRALNEMNSDPQLALAQLLLGEVAEESCLWVSTE